MNAAIVVLSDHTSRGMLFKRNHIHGLYALYVTAPLFTTMTESTIWQRGAHLSAWDIRTLLSLSLTCTSLLGNQE